MIPIPRTTRLALPTGQRVEVRVDLSVRVMLRSGLIRDSDEMVLLDALDDVSITDRALGRSLQDALVLHALQLSKPSELNALADAEYLAILEFAIQRFAPAEVEDEEETEDAEEEEVLGVVTPEESLEDELERARRESLPEIKVPASAEVLDKIEQMEAERAE